MIVTITCNPAIDKTIYEDKVVFDIGGKGINVSKTLKNLGVESIATGFVGRNNKNVIIDALNELKIENHFIEVDGDVRTNTKRIINNELYEENQKGPLITDQNKAELLKYLSNFKNDIVILSGSCTANIYYDLVSELKKNNNYVILDSDKQLLKDGVKAKPDVIKPNINEICNYFDCDYNEDLIIKKILELDLDLVCLSLANKGSIFVYKGKVYKVDALDIDYKSSLGAGDSMVAGIAYGVLHNFDIMGIIKFATACASAACETEGSKPPEKVNVFEKQERVKVFLL